MPFFPYGSKGDCGGGHGEGIPRCQDPVSVFPSQEFKAFQDGIGSRENGDRITGFIAALVNIAVRRIDVSSVQVISHGILGICGTEVSCVGRIRGSCSDLRGPSDKKVILSLRFLSLIDGHCACSDEGPVKEASVIVFPGDQPAVFGIQGFFHRCAEGVFSKCGP